MRIRGKFIDITNTNTYYVQIGGSGPYKDIKAADEYDPEDTESIFFASDPVSISSDMSDTFENVYIRQCTISLLCNYDLRPFIIANNYTDIPVVVRKNTATGDIIFSGYAIPFNFNQSYSTEYNEIQIECCDKLGILEYIKLPELPENPQINTVDYSSPRYFMDAILRHCNFSTILYSIAYDHTQDTKINPQIFIGDSKDDWMTCKEVLEEIGKIYGCWFYQNGDTCVVENILQYNLNNEVAIDKDDYMSDDTNISVDQAYNSIKCTVDLSTIGDTFVNPFDDEFMEPAQDCAERVLTEIIEKNDDDSYDRIKSFRDTIHKAVGNPPLVPPVKNWSAEQQTDTNLEVYDNLCQIMKNRLFDFSNEQHADYPNDTYLNFTTWTDNNKDSRATQTLRWLWQHPGRGAFLSFGKTQNVVNPKNTETVQLKDMKTNLFIQVCGTRTIAGDYGNDTRWNDEGRLVRRTAIYNKLADQIEANNPICSFTIDKSYSLTPNDTSTTNYLVFSGKIRLNPIVGRTGPEEREHFDWDEYDVWRVYARSHTNQLNTTNTYLQRLNWARVCANALPASYLLKAVVQKDDDDKGCFYMNYGWNNVAPGWDQQTGIVYEWPWNAESTSTNGMLMPYLSANNELFKYEGSAYMGNGEANQCDNVRKVAILACELKIGDKYLIEDLSQLQNQNWAIPYSSYNKVYTWLTEDQLPVWNGVKQTWFTIGIDPSVGDSLIGKEFDIQNTVDLRMNIDAKGLAIPIYYKDQLNGKVEFKILGPYNSWWTNAKRVKHGAWFWKSYGTNTTDYPILAYVENIQLSDFEMKLYSSNGGKTAKNTDNDLVYESINSQLYTEDNEFNCQFCTSLTTDEVNDLGIDYNLNNSSILDNYNSPWYGMTNYPGIATGATYAKLEEARVSEQYNMWGHPRNIITTTLKLKDPEIAYDKTNYTFDYLTYNDAYNTSQIYRTTAREISLKQNTMTCTMKEYSNKPS